MNPNDKKIETTTEKKHTHNVKDTSGHPVAEVTTEEAEKVAGGVGVCSDANCKC